MDDAFSALGDEIRRALRFRWSGLFIAIAIASVAATVVTLLPDQYSASARIAVNLDRNGEVPSIIVDAEDGLLSDLTLERTLGKIDFGTSGMAPSEVEGAKNTLKRRIHLTGMAGETLTVQFSDADPARALGVVQEILASFQDYVSTIGEVGSEGAVRTLEDLIKATLARTNEAERKVTDYRLQHMDIFGQGGVEERLDQAKVAVDTAQANYRTAVSWRDQNIDALRSGRAESGGLSVMPPQLVSGDPVINQINTLYLQLVSLRSLYSDNYPDVISTSRELNGLLLQFPADENSCQVPATMGDKTAARAPNGIAPSSAPGPVYLSASPAYDSAAPSAEDVTIRIANVVACRSKQVIASSQAEFNGLKALQASAYPIQSEMRRLTADRDAAQGRLQDLWELQRGGAGGPVSDLYTIDQSPEFPIAPSGPNRRLWLMAVLAAALAGGVFFAYLRALIAVSGGHDDSASEDYGAMSGFAQFANVVVFWVVLLALVGAIAMLAASQPQLDDYRQAAYPFVRDVLGMVTHLR